MNKDKLGMARTDRDGLSEEIRHGEVNNRLRHDVSEGQADQRHDMSEENADQRHSENCNQHGSTRRILYCVVGSLIAVIALGVIYHHWAMFRAVKKNVSLRQENAVLRNKNAQGDALAEGFHRYQDSLNKALKDKEEKIKAAEKTAAKRKTHNQMMKKFMSIQVAVTRDNPTEMMYAVENIGEPENLLTMKFYPLVLEIACGLGAFNILSHITAIEGWDKTIPVALAQRVLNPHTVPLQKFQQLEARYNQQSGRLADMVKAKENLETQVYDEKYLPYSRERVMIIEAYHTVSENVRPKNLTKWIGTATPDQWVAYLKMAVARSSDNVYQAILEHHEVTSIAEVASFIEATEVLAKLKR